MRLLSICLLVCYLRPSLPAQTANGLDLQVRPEQTEAGVPQAFSFLLTNHSPGNLLIAKPLIGCGSAFNGSLSLQLRFTPSSPPAHARLGHLCTADRWDWPPVLERIKRWQVLAPGQSISLRASRTELFYNDVEAGSYEFWADYTPPFVSAQDRQTLHNAGWTVPLDEISSRHITFQKAIPQNPSR